MILVMLLIHYLLITFGTFAQGVWTVNLNHEARNSAAQMVLITALFKMN